MGIRVTCPNGHNLKVKDTQAGRRGICPECGAKFKIPAAADLAEPAGSTASLSPEPIRPDKPPSFAPKGFPIVAEPARSTVRTHSRRRRQSVQLVVWLTIAVIVLAAVFAWVVLNR